MAIFCAEHVPGQQSLFPSGLPVSDELTSALLRQVRLEYAHSARRLSARVLSEAVKVAGCDHCIRVTSQNPLHLFVSPVCVPTPQAQSRWGVRINLPFRYDSAADGRIQKVVEHLLSRRFFPSGAPLGGGVLVSIEFAQFERRVLHRDGMPFVFFTTEDESVEEQAPVSSPTLRLLKAVS